MVKGEKSRGGGCVGGDIDRGHGKIQKGLGSHFGRVMHEKEIYVPLVEGFTAHFISTKGTTTTPLVRVPWNDPVLIKPVLDIGAAGVVVPMIRTVDDVRRAVAACRYPPDGIRGYGPRRPSNYVR